MIRKLFAALGGFVLLIVTAGFIVTISLFVFASFLLTLPLHPLKLRDKKLRATVQVASSVMTLVTVLGQDNATKALADALDAGIDATEMRAIDPDEPDNDLLRHIDED